MQWIRSGIEIFRSREVIGRCGGDEKIEMTTQNRQKLNDKKLIQKKLYKKTPKKTH